MFMNKKVLTLCAGFLLAGGLVNFASAEDVTIGDLSQKVGYLKGNGDYFFFANGDLFYGFEKQEDGTFKEKVVEKNWNIPEEDVKNYLCKVDSVALDGASKTVWAYSLVNVGAGDKQLVFKSGTTNQVGWVDFTATPEDEFDTKGYFVFDGRTTYNKAVIAGQTGIYDGLQNTSINPAPTSWAALRLDGYPNYGGLYRTTTSPASGNDFFFYKYVDQEMGDNLNDLYNSIGFNFGIDGEDDVDNIFDQEGVRIRAIHLADDVESEESRDFKFPAGIYFVTETPAEAWDVNASEGEKYTYLMNCTFIAASPSLNDINLAADRKTGKGFQLTTISARDLNFNNYTGNDKSRMSKGEDISVYNACFNVLKNADGRFDLSLAKFRFNEKADSKEQTPAANVRFAVTAKTGDDHSEKYLTTVISSTPNYYFVYKETNTAKATDFLNEKAKKIYTFNFVSEDEDLDGKYLYTSAYGTNGVYAKGAAFVDPALPEAQWIVTDVDQKDNTVTFTNRANNAVSFATKLYLESDGSYTLALDDKNFQYTNLNVDAEGTLKAETPKANLHASRVELTEVTADKFAGTWNVADETEVTMLFARDNTPTSNKLYVSFTRDKDGKIINNKTAIEVTNKLAQALQFELIKSEDSLVVTNPYAYKEGDAIKYATVGDTIAYYTYALQAFSDGVAVKVGNNDSYLAYSGNAYKLAGATKSTSADQFIIKETATGTIALIPVSVNASSTAAQKATAYKGSQAVMVKNWKKPNNEIDDYVESSHGLVKDALTETMHVDYIKTYLNIEAPEVSLDADKSYIQIKSEVGETYLAKNDENDAIMAAAAEAPMTIRVFATDTKKAVPSFYIATDWNANGERMFLFNPKDSVDYYVAEGEYNKKYQWNDVIGNDYATKVIFKQAYLDESLANLDTLVTEIKGEKATIAQEADNNKKVQAGLDKFKFQIILADNEDNLYWIRQNGQYLRSINGKLTLDGDRTMALKVEVVDTDAPTANESINAAEAVQVVATDGAVIVKGAEGKNVIVSTILGKVVANEVLNSDNETIAAPAGIVVVSVDGESFKVAVK